MLMRKDTDNRMFRLQTESFVDKLMADGRLQPIPFLPQRVERSLYIDISRLLMFSFQHAILGAHGSAVWGHVMNVNMVPTYGAELMTEQSAVGIAQLGVVVDHMLDSGAVHMPLVPRPLERRLYMNCMMLTFQLVEGLLAGAGQEVNCLGHTFRFRLDPLPVHAVEQMLKDMPVQRCTIDEAILTELVDELLNEPEVNLLWVPDAIESQIYRSAIRLIIRVIEEVICRFRLNILGREIHMSIFSMLKAERVRAKASHGDKQSAGGFLYFEEENPLKTVSSTELEEHLRDLDEQRRVLEALRVLGGADFDLACDVPMLQPPKKEADEDTSENSEDEDAEEEKIHEFQRLAHSNKLVRCLQLQFVVAGDIRVPYRIIADLEGYTEWMPFCTSGRCESHTGLGMESQPRTFEADVGFGIDTGTFLGTVGETVRYTMTVTPPAPVAGRAGKEVMTAHVIADAADSFTYGERLVYDWHFVRLSEGETKVELNLLFQARNVLYLPIWDSMQNMIVKNLVSAFVSRAEKLEAEKTGADNGSGGSQARGKAVNGARQ